MAKQRAERLNEHSNHALGRTVPNKSVSRTLLELREKAEREPKHRFRSLYREINLPMLYESFRDLKRKAAPGVDGVTVASYEGDLDNNLRQLLERLVRKTYRAQNVRRRLIPKGGGKTRPLGIPALEDKIVQQAANKLLQAIFEADFLDESKGYRPKRGARDASQELREKLVLERVHWVVEADIKGFFDQIKVSGVKGLARGFAFEHQTFAATPFGQAARPIMTIGIIARAAKEGMGREITTALTDICKITALTKSPEWDRFPPKGQFRCVLPDRLQTLLTQIATDIAGSL